MRIGLFKLFKTGSRHQQPAGLRTHIIIAIGATLLIVLSISVAQQHGDVRGDAGRIAAQVVFGIGSLGAGPFVLFALIILDQITDRWFPQQVIKELEVHTRADCVKTDISRRGRWK